MQFLNRATFVNGLVRDHGLLSILATSLRDSLLSATVPKPTPAQLPSAANNNNGNNNNSNEDPHSAAITPFLTAMSSSSIPFSPEARTAGLSLLNRNNRIPQRRGDVRRIANGEADLFYGNGGANGGGGSGGGGGGGRDGVDDGAVGGAGDAGGVGGA